MIDTTQELPTAPEARARPLRLSELARAVGRHRDTLERYRDRGQAGVRLHCWQEPGLVWYSSLAEWDRFRETVRRVLAERHRRELELRQQALDSLLERNPRCRADRQARARRLNEEAGAR